MNSMCGSHMETFIYSQWSVNSVVSISCPVWTDKTSNDTPKLPLRSGIFCGRWDFHVSCKWWRKSKWEPNLLRVLVLGRLTFSAFTNMPSIIRRETAGAWRFLWSKTIIQLEIDPICLLNSLQPWERDRINNHILQLTEPLAYDAV